jgi:hypothetical protein
VFFLPRLHCTPTTCRCPSMKSMFFFTALTLRWCLSAGSTRSYFHRQDRMCLLSYIRKTTLLFSFELNLLYKQASSHTSWLKAYFL